MSPFLETGWGFETVSRARGVGVGGGFCSAPSEAGWQKARQLPPGFLSPRGLALVAPPGCLASLHVGVPANGPAASQHQPPAT